MNDSKKHAFSIELACKYGIVCSLLIEHLCFWITKNKKNNKAFRDGEYWMFQSIHQMQEEVFPYLSIKQIRIALERLENLNIIKSSNEKSWNRTKWYTFAPEGKCILQNYQMDLPSTANALCQKGKPIKDTKKDIKKDNKTIYGEFQNVYLSEDDISNLKKLTNETDLWIKNLDEYIEQTGKEYKNHYLTLKNWISKKQKEGRRPDEFFY